MQPIIGILILAVAMLALAVIAERRHTRLRGRVRTLEKHIRGVEARTDRAERHVYAALARQRLHAAGREPVMPVRFLSQFGEDAFIWDLLDGQLDGFYIEVGAFDGENLSTTYALESVGWTGLLVEPLPARFDQCVKNRPKSRVVRAAVGARGATGSVQFEALESQIDPMADLASSIRLPKIQQELAAHAQAATRKVEAPLTTLARLLDEPSSPPSPPSHSLRIDIAVIDVEGFERDVLDGLELERFRPRVLFVEDLTGGAETAAAEILHSAGFIETGWLGHNRVWVDGREPVLVRRARMLHEGGAAKRGLA